MTTPTNTPTPRTDALAKRAGFGVGVEGYIDAVYADFARTLERENQQLRQANLDANAAIGDIANECKKFADDLNHFKQLAEEWRKEAAHLLDCYSTAYEMPLNTHPVQGHISTVTFNRLRKALQQPKKDE